MIVTAVEVLVWILLIGGMFFSIVGGIGLLRLPDVFSRMHGSGMTDTLGAGLILGGLTVHAIAATVLLRNTEPGAEVVLNGLQHHSGLGLVAVKLIAVLFFLLVTSPTSTHALCRSALAEGVRPWTLDEGNDEADEVRPSNT